MGGKGEEDIKGDRWVMPFTGLRDTEKVPVWERNSNIKSWHYILKEFLRHASGVIKLEDDYVAMELRRDAWSRDSCIRVIDICHCCLVAQSCPTLLRPHGPVTCQAPLNWQETGQLLQNICPLEDMRMAREEFGGQESIDF